MSEEFYNAPSEASPRVSHRLKSFLTSLVIVGLLGAVGYLLADRNHRTYSVVRQGNSLVVMRGLMLPFGSEPYQPTERALAEAYAPIPLQGDSPGELLSRSYSDRDELDRELFRTLAAWIGSRLGADSPDRLKEAVTYLRRAEKLSGITEDERKQLDEMRAETGFYEGRAKLDEGLDALTEALDKLELAAGSKSRHAREASALLLQIQEPMRAAIRAARVAPTAASLLVPPPAPAPTAPQPHLDDSPSPAAPAPAAGTPPSSPAPAKSDDRPKDTKDASKANGLPRSSV